MRAPLIILAVLAVVAGFGPVAHGILGMPHLSTLGCISTFRFSFPSCLSLSVWGLLTSYTRGRDNCEHQALREQILFR